MKTLLYWSTKNNTRLKSCYCMFTVYTQTTWRQMGSIHYSFCQCLRGYFV